MKKYLFLAAITLVFAACSNEENEVTNDNWNGEIRLSSSNTASPAKRSLSQDLQSTKFDAGETIGVFINENVSSNPSVSYTQPLVCTVAQDQSGLNFNVGLQYFPQNNNGVNIYGIYPASAVTDKQVNSEITFSVQTDQSTDAAYKESDLMIGKPSNPVKPTKDPVNLLFTHILSKIDINLTSGKGTPILTGAIVKIKNVFTQTTFTPNTSAIADAKDAKNEKADVTAANAIDNNKKCSAIIIPQTVPFNGNAFIEITLANQTVLNYKLGNETTFEGAKKYTYNITVNLKEDSTPVTISATISDWGDGGITNGDAEMTD